MTRTYNISATILPVILLSTLLFLSTSLYGQEPQFSQFYAAPIYLNPAFTGLTPQGRLTTIYRSQWPSLPKSFVSYSAAFDYNIAKYKSGLGLIITYDQAGSGGLKSFNIAGTYSYNFKISDKIYVRTGVKGAYANRNYDNSKLIFADQIIRDGASTSVEGGLQQTNSYLDLGAGALIHGENYWGGLSFDHMNQPNQSLIGETTKLPLKMYVHAGYKFVFNKKRFGKKDSESGLTITGNFKTQLKWDQLDLGVYYNRDFFTVGVWYRGIPVIKSYQPGYANNEALILLLGMYFEGVKMGYSYDITISKLGFVGGANEISLSYEFPRAKVKQRRVFCPKF